MNEETRTNARHADESHCVYTVRRCVAIRQSYRDNNLTLPEAHAGISEYLRAHGVSVIDGVSPTVWLLIS